KYYHLYTRPENISRGIAIPLILMYPYDVVIKRMRQNICRNFFAGAAYSLHDCPDHYSTG
ncbi:hypothetical protein, partial [Christensenella hongkongensis]|uniref:hypothetical protein n=1 Tax=Christensenella hongkongensis TaxID=270498 RepID=UPI0026721394